jgi:hypothetical protein
VRKVLNKSIILLFILSILCTATAAFGDFVPTRIEALQPHIEILHMLLLGFGLFVLAAVIRDA